MLITPDPTSQKNKKAQCCSVGSKQIHGFQTYEQLSRDLDSLRGLRGLRRGLRVFRAPLRQKKIWQLAGLHLSTVGIFH